jgi:hypothetical protein
MLTKSTYIAMRGFFSLKGEYAPFSASIDACSLFYYFISQVSDNNHTSKNPKEELQEVH